MVEAWQAGEQWVMRRTAPDRGEARLERWRPVGFVGASGAFAVQSGSARELRLGWWTTEASAPRAVEVAPGTIASWAMVLADRLVYPVVRAAGVALAVAAPDRTAWVELPGAAPNGQLRVVSATESGWLGLIEPGSMRGWAVDLLRGESRVIAAAPLWSLVDETGAVVRAQIDGADKRFVRGTEVLPGAFAPDQIVELDSRGGTLIVRGRYASEALFVPEFGRERVQTLLLRSQSGVSRTLRSEALTDAIEPLVTLDGTCAAWIETGPTPNSHRVSVLDVLSGVTRPVAFESEHPLRVAWLE